jgi:hypothetical protein
MLFPLSLVVLQFREAWHRPLGIDVCRKILNRLERTLSPFPLEKIADEFVRVTGNFPDATNRNYVLVTQYRYTV